MSVCSNASAYSTVSYGGEEVDAGTAVDESMIKLQQGINNTHCLVREMLSGDERGDTHEEQTEKQAEVVAQVKEAIVLLKDLTTLSKQLIPPKPRAAK